MKRGLVIGNFCPLHRGHLALIRFAAGHCDELIVSMSYRPGDPIDPALRISWISETVKDNPIIKPQMVLDDFDDETLPFPERMSIWADFIKKRYPKIDLLFSSEAYGEPFGTALEVPHFAFVKEKGQEAVSASLIRERPFQHWEDIPEIVRPYFVKKICLYGAECTGKTTLARRLAEVYNTEFVPEVAREIITSNDFSVEDIIKIGHAQTERVFEKAKASKKVLFCDTDLITTEIYSDHYLHQVPPILYELEKQVKYDLYFLLDIDVPWVPDGLRNLGHLREVMHQKFKSALEERKIPFVEVRGNFEERERFVRERVDRLLKNSA